MDPRARWNAIAELLGEVDVLTVHDAARRLGVSPATIRRDFDELAQQQMLMRTRGGAMANGISYDLPLRYKTARQADEKRRIGAAAAALIPARSIVGLTGGTTVTEVARALCTRPDVTSERGAPTLTIVTNALNIAHENLLRPNVKMVVTGGVARPQSYELVGLLAEPVLDQLSLDYAVLGVDGIAADFGASTENEGEAGINRTLARRADSVIVVADASKLGKRAFARICPIDVVNILVTDTSASDAALEPFRNMDVEVIRA